MDRTDMGFMILPQYASLLQSIKRRQQMGGKGIKKSKRYYSVAISRLYKEMRHNPSLADDFGFNVRLHDIIRNEKLMAVMSPDYIRLCKPFEGKRVFLESCMSYRHSGTRYQTLSSHHTVIAAEVFGDRELAYCPAKLEAIRRYIFRLKHIHSLAHHPKCGYQETVVRYVGGTEDLVHTLFIIFGRRDYMGDIYETYK